MENEDVAIPEETEEKKELFYMRIYREDKEWLVGTREFEEYLVFKYKLIPKRQEDFMRLVIFELKEILAKK